MTNHAALRAWYDAGCTPLPVAPDSSKRPAVSHWRQLQGERPPLDQLTPLWTADSDGVGVICGTASGNLEMLELEGAAVQEGALQRLAETFAAHGQSDLWQTIVSGYVEITPSGGMHFYYRTPGPTKPNTKLARRPATAEELEARPGNRIIVLIETRGQGGWSVVAPSAGRSHPTGGAWRAILGTPATIPTISDEQRDLVHDLCQLLDAMPMAEASSAPMQPSTPRADGELRPGDDFNDRARWEDILGPHGWTVDSRRGKEIHWIRPGKKRGEGIAATTGHSDDGADRLYVFSSSTEFEQDTPYSKFAAYALLEHSGDHTAAAKKLQADGYGSGPTIITPQDIVDPQAWANPPANPAPAASMATNGSSALAPTPKLVAVSQAAQAYGPTEDGTARALAHLHRHELRFCAQRGSWLAWTGARWAWDEAQQHRQFIKELARGLPEDKDWRGYKKRALSATGTTGIARQAESEPAFAVHINDLDSNTYELNTPGGVVDLRTGQMRAPDPAALHTRTTRVAPDFDRRSDVFEEFLNQTFGHDQELITYVQRMVGVSAIGTVLEQVLPFAHGSGANGKSTLIEACMDVLGTGETGYAIAAPAEMLMVRRHSEHPTELAQLAGARLVVCSELEDGARFAEARVKQLTGRDSINARFMRKDPFTFTPTHTIWMIANHKPQAATGGPAFWRRLQLIPFEHVVPEGQRNKKLGEQLQAEAPAILAWIIRGAADYLTQGLAVPGTVTTATADYATDQDTIGRFVEEQCTLRPGDPVAQVRVAEFRSAYETWCHEGGDIPASSKRLTNDLEARFGVKSVKGGRGVRFYQGVLLPYLQRDNEGWMP